ncbi:MAG: leucine-rich repeat protein [Clostridia bacterium]|nr:leucine-rich repeat protein [Clostridia bacterium]
MSWVCPMCSTNNEDSEKICIVCEYERVSDKVCTLTLNKVQKLGLSGDVVVPDEFNVIGEGAFKGREDIYSVTLHDNVKKISKEAFSGCRNLRSVRFGGMLDSIGIKAFCDCTSLPVSSRPKSKYTAKDAYYLTPAPKPAPKPEKKVEAPTTAVKKTATDSRLRDTADFSEALSRTVKKPEPTPSAYSSTGTDYRAYDGFNWHKLTACVILLGISAAILIPLLGLFVSEFLDEGDVWYYAVIGFALISMLVYCIYSKFSDYEHRELIRENKLLLATSFLTVSYLLSFLFPLEFKWVSVCLCLIVLGGEIVMLVRTIYYKEYENLKALISYLAINAVLLWRILVL